MKWGSKTDSLIICIIMVLVSKYKKLPLISSQNVILKKKKKKIQSSAGSIT